MTGASSGIGAATAQLLAREGADAALLARREEGLLRVAARVREEGRQALILPTDVADPAALEASVAKAIRQLGGRLARARAHANDAPRGLWEPSGDGTLDGHLHGRPSLLAALQLRGARPHGGADGS